MREEISQIELSPKQSSSVTSPDHAANMRIEVLDLGAKTFHFLTANVVGGCVVPIEDTAIDVRGGGATDAIAELLGRSQTRPTTIATVRDAELARIAARTFGLHVAILSP